MTRKDYQLIANSLNVGWKKAPALSKERRTVDDCAVWLCAALEKDNDKFDSVKFLDAVYK